MPRFLSIALLCCAACCSSAWAGENWPQLLGPQGDGHAESKDLPIKWSETENVVWKTPIHGKGWSSPVVWGNQIWMCTAPADGKQMFGVCVDKNSGKVVYDLKLFDVAEPQFCHDLNSQASCTPVIEEGRVYLHFGAYGTACVDTATGKTLWSRNDLPCNHYRGPGSSPILAGDLLIVHYDGFDFQYVQAFDKHTGKTVWKKDRNIDYGTDNGDIYKAYSTPTLITVNDREQLISTTSKAVLAYEPKTGEEIWRVRYKGFSATARPLYANGLLFINTGFSKADLLAVLPNGTGDVTETHVVWTTSKSVPSKPSQLLFDDLLFMIHDGGVASCLEAKTGELVWSQRLGGNFSSSPLYAAGRLYCFSQEGVCTVLAASREYSVLSTNTLSDGFMASPAASGSALILRTRTHLYRIENKP